MAARRETKKVGRGKRGRPTKRRRDIRALVRKYIDVECAESIDLRRRRYNSPLPTIDGFALYHGVSRDTLYALAKKHEGYRDAIEEIGSEQFDRLIEHGLNGSYNATFAKRLLLLNHRKPFRLYPLPSYSSPPDESEARLNTMAEPAERREHVEEPATDPAEFSPETLKMLEEYREARKKRAAEQLHQKYVELDLGIKAFEMGTRGHIQRAERLWKLAEELNCTGLLPSEIWHAARRARHGNE